MSTLFAAQEALTKAKEGLLYSSEDDQSWKLFTWYSELKKLTDRDLIELAGQDPNVKVVRMNREDFFKDLLEGDFEKKGYEELYNTLSLNLDNIEVVRFGEVIVAIYIFGLTSDGYWTGICTLATET